MRKNSKPNISVNKLAEYIVSRGNRQREILRDRKFPQDFKGMYHKEASEAICQCLANNLEDLSPLTRARRSLEQKSSEKVGTQRRINSNIDAIESFDTLLDKIDLLGSTPEHGDHIAQKIVRHGVEISVRPDIILRGTGRSKKPLIGGIKIHYSRTRPLSAESAGYVSAMVQQYCSEVLAVDEAVNPQYCFVVDIGSMQIYPGVSSTIQRMKDVEAECRNIAALWESIEENE